MSVVAEEPLTERDKVSRHRWAELADLGFAPQEARLIAETLPDHRSWHEFKDLIDRGCSPELAMEILL